MILITELFSFIGYMVNRFSLSCQLRSIGRAWLLRKTVEIRPRYFKKRLLLLISAVCYVNSIGEITHICYFSKVFFIHNL